MMLLHLRMSTILMMTIIKLPVITSSVALGMASINPFKLSR